MRFVALAANRITINKTWYGVRDSPPRPSGYVYLGRIDYQVKIGGFRVELYEIESVLLQHSQITQAAVICVEEDSGSKTMIAFYGAQQVINPKDIDSF